MIDVRMKQLFFDSKKVRRAVDRTTRRVLSRFGAFVRRAARSSIRKRKRVSEPGNPPSSHTGLLRRFIWFAYEPDKRSVIIGPARLTGDAMGEAPEALEYGGKIEKQARRISASDFLDWGYGPIRVGGPGGRLTPTETGKQLVTRAPITTRRQARRASRIHNSLGIGGYAKTQISPRPYMRPAFAKERPKLPGMWKNSIR
jgi:hypothetical protein